MYAVKEKNLDFIDFKTINFIMIDRNPSKTLKLSPSDIIHFKYAPVTSADMERRFHLYKNMLRPNRRHSTFAQFKEIIIIQHHISFE